jgi:hypothetical protein
MRNVVEHSQAEGFGVCGQAWPKLHRAEISIVDAGVGIRKSLAQNSALNIQSDQDAIDFAIKPGISRVKSIGGAQANQYDVWKNTGYGLYMTKRICGEGGKFTLASSAACIEIDGERSNNHDLKFEGTVLRLAIEQNAIENFNERRIQYSNEGSEEARLLQQFDAITNAGSSTMSVSNNFNKSSDS